MIILAKPTCAYIYKRKATLGRSFDTFTVYHHEMRYKRMRLSDLVDPSRLRSLTRLAYAFICTESGNGGYAAACEYVCFNILITTAQCTTRTPRRFERLVMASSS